jgi:manganese transport protein
MVPLEDWPENALVQVHATGAAFLLIHRSVFDAVADWMRQHKPNSPYVWFEDDSIGGGELGEDVVFCYRAQSAGIDVFVNTGCVIGHRKPVVFVLWVIAEIVAMATDLAEFIGAAIALNLLFGLPLLPAALVTAVGSYAILWLQTSRGFRHMEAVITGLLGIIIVGFVVQVILAGPNGVDVAEGLFIPGFDGTESVLLAAGILGATVMPHVIYLHSALTKPRAKGRSEEERSRLIRFERIDVVIAMAIAGLVNMSMLIVAAAAFHSRGLTDVVDLEEVHALLGPILGSSAPVLFALALLASGLSSSSVGTLAGQVIMEGFIHRRIPLWLRRGITMAPAIAIIAIGVNPTRALIISQVVLSFGIPFALIPLILASRDRGLMGRFRLGTRGLVAAVLVACVILALNVFLLGKLALG